MESGDRTLRFRADDIGQGNCPGEPPVDEHVHDRLPLGEELFDVRAARIDPLHPQIAWADDGDGTPIDRALYPFARDRLKVPH
jgi:hypothetical protein